MTRPDSVLTAQAAAVLAVLLAVSCRASPTRHDVEVTLYVVAGALELTGALTVGFGLREGRRRARVYEAQRRIVNLRGFAARGRARASLATLSGGRTPTLEERVAAVEHRTAGMPDRICAAVDGLRQELQDLVRREASAVERDSRRRDQEVAELVGGAGPSIVSWIGFASLVVGIVLGTVANLIGATG